VRNFGLADDKRFVGEIIMTEYLILLVVALVISALGFYKFVWYISLGYGFSVFGLGIALLAMFREGLEAGTIVFCILFMIYGLRLGGYLLFRELKSAAYNKKMKEEINDGSGMGIIPRLFIWITCAFLYTCEISPVFFRLYNGGGVDGFLYTGIIISVCGIILESASDLQKSSAKKINPSRFVDTGLFKIVRCPNYLGEILMWTGVFVSGLNILQGAQWAFAIFGYVCIVYIMFGGARRLELRQNRTYGDDPEYQAYVRSVPIILPLIPLYSVARHKWLVG